MAYTAHEAGWAVLLRTDLSEVLNIDVEIPCLERAGKVKKERRSIDKYQNKVVYFFQVELTGLPNLRS